MELDSNSSVSYEWILMILCVDKGRSTMLCLELYKGTVDRGIEFDFISESYGDIAVLRITLYFRARCNAIYIDTKSID